MRKQTRPPTHPGGILKRHYLEPLSLNISKLASLLGVSRKTLSKIVNERGNVTPEMALRLSKALGTTPELWLNLQNKYSLWYMEKNHPEINKIEQVEELHLAS